jgi:hypothetical protein
MATKRTESGLTRGAPRLRFDRDATVSLAALLCGIIGQSGRASSASHGVQ